MHRRGGQVMFNIGDEVFHAHCEMRDKWITCPDCFGTKTLKVILGDGTELVIPCAGCGPGYEPPRGVVKTYERSPGVEVFTISGIEITRERIKYHASSRILNSENVFATKEEAQARSLELAALYEKEEAARLQRKERDTHSWAWHVHYHRSKIRNAKKEIELSEEKLGIAQIRAKGGSHRTSNLPQ
jgi:hypothetical protein